jgi:hypothetical protein
VLSQFDLARLQRYYGRQCRQLLAGKACAKIFTADLSDADLRTHVEYTAISNVDVARILQVVSIETQLRIQRLWMFISCCSQVSRHRQFLSVIFSPLPFDKPDAPDHAFLAQLKMGFHLASLALKIIPMCFQLHPRIRSPSFITPS